MEFRGSIWECAAQRVVCVRVLRQRIDNSEKMEWVSQIRIGAVERMLAGLDWFAGAAIEAGSPCASDHW